MNAQANTLFNFAVADALPGQNRVVDTGTGQVLSPFVWDPTRTVSRKDPQDTCFISGIDLTRVDTQVIDKHLIVKGVLSTWLNTEVDNLFEILLDTDMSAATGQQVDNDVTGSTIGVDYVVQVASIDGIAPYYIANLTRPNGTRTVHDAWVNAQPSGMAGQEGSFTVTIPLSLLGTLGSQLRLYVTAGHIGDPERTDVAPTTPFVINLSGIPAPSDPGQEPSGNANCSSSSSSDGPSGGSGGGSGGDLIPPVGDGRHTLYMVFDGASVSRADLVRWSADWSADSQQYRDELFDADGNGIQVSPFLAGVAGREQIIDRVMTLMQDDLRPFGITVVRHSGPVVEGVGATTLFVGPASIPVASWPINPTPGEIGRPAGIAGDIDFDNNNGTDICFSLEWFYPELVSYGATAEQIAVVMADLSLHEGGHTFGLYHVDSPYTNEAMGLGYSEGTGIGMNAVYQDRLHNEFENHGYGHGPQNSYRTMLQNFSAGSSATTTTGSGGSTATALHMDSFHVPGGAVYLYQIDQSQDVHDHGSSTAVHHAGHDHGDTTDPDESGKKNLRRARRQARALSKLAAADPAQEAALRTFGNVHESGGLSKGHRHDHGAKAGSSGKSHHHEHNGSSRAGEHDTKGRNADPLPRIVSAKAARAIDQLLADHHTEGSPIADLLVTIADNVF
jgi:hypothetical protein